MTAYMILPRLSMMSAARCSVIAALSRPKHGACLYPGFRISSCIEVRDISDTVIGG
jgi:hypothetical protein